MFNDSVVKIAKQIYALNFRKIKNKNKIVLMDNKFDVSPQYIIFINNGFYVYKLLQFKNITVFDILPKLKHRGFLPSTAQHRLLGD